MCPSGDHMRSLGELNLLPLKCEAKAWEEQNTKRSEEDVTSL